MSATITGGLNEIEILRSFARRIDVADPGAQNNLGVFYFRRGLVDEAIAAFSRALALDERMRVARRNLEIAYGKAGSLKSRVTELDQRLAAAPQQGSTHLTLALALRLKGYHAEAMRECRAALAAGEEPAATLEAIGSLHLLLAQPSDALDSYDKRIKLGGASPRVINQRGI